MSRHFPLMIACLVMAPLVAAAQGRYQPRGYPPCPTCEAGPQQPSCEAPRPTCEAPPPCKPPCNPPPQQPMMIQQPGMFVQPPASGTVQGPVEQSGIEGATVTFPELSLRMPSIRFPARSRSRQNARMLLDQQYAPYVESPPVAAMPASAAATAPAAPMAAAPAAQPMMAAAPQMQMMMAPAAPQMQMMMMPQQMMMTPMPMTPQQQYYIPQPAPQQNPVQQNPVQPMQAPQPEPENAPPSYRTPAPSCDARGNPLALNTAEEKLRQLELAEQQLMQRMEVLRRQLEQAEVSRRVPTPSPDLGARTIQLPTAQPLRATGIQPVQPVSQPPLPPAVSIYNERPATYISEPQPLPQYQQPQPQYAQPQYLQPQPVYYQQQPACSQQSQVIREPQATITGVRTR